MKRWLINTFTPLNIFNIHGSICCENMYKFIHEKAFIKLYSCFLAQCIEDANLLILWGDFSQKLLNLVINKYELMPKNRVLIHICGCQKEINSQEFKDNLSDKLPVNISYKNCNLNQSEIIKMIDEARRCLRA